MNRFVTLATDFVDLDGQRRTKAENPYSYDAFYLFGGAEGRALAEQTAYSDRLRQWDEAKFDRALTAARGQDGGGASLSGLSSAEASRFLSTYLGRSVDVTALAEGCNPSNGDPYQVLWFRETADGR